MTESQIVSELLKMTEADTRDRDDENRSPFLETNRARTRELGQRLHDLGGFQMMQRAWAEIPKFDQLELTAAWDRIGDWRW